MKVLGLVTAAAVAAFLSQGSAAAAGADYLGSWTIASAVAAPWADRAQPPDAAERARLIGKAITFKARAITGPQPLACQGAQYKISEFTADLLFQGAFDEMRSKDRRVDPDRIAKSLGFTSPKIRTLETGCEIDIHFVNASTAEFGLNNYVYTIRRK